MLLATKILIGFIVGTLIGMTGVGGGVLLLPLLIFVLKVPAMLAVGTDALFNFGTKIPAGLMHIRSGTVKRRVLLALATGSVPGSILGVSFLGHLRTVYGSGVNGIVSTAIGILLVIVPSVMFFQRRIEERVVQRPPTLKSALGMVILGFSAGFLVGMTSVGSGSIIMMLMLLFYSFPPKMMVGTDVVHAVILTGMTSLMHFRLHNIEYGLVGCLLLGSIPGGLLGSYLATRVPVKWLRRILCTVLLITGVRMLWPVIF